MSKLIAPQITIRNACLRYQNQILFQDLYCELPAGQTTCLLGPSGVGKTTLLRMIAGFTVHQPDTCQSVEIITSDQTALTHRIAYLAQTDLLLPWRTALENVLLGIYLRGQLKTPVMDYQQQAFELLKKVGLAAATNKYPRQLSGGMRQRVALARTLMEQRPVVLMDEPFSALDTVTRLRLQTLAAELLKERTVLLITHDPLEALRLGHQIFIMSGQPAQLSEPLHLPGVPPRELTDPQLLYWQGKLMQQLVISAGEFSS